MLYDNEMSVGLDALMNGGETRTAQNADGALHVYYNPCQTSQTVTLPDCVLADSGRMLHVNMTLRNVCPGKRVALGVAVNEVDEAGNEYPRGFRSAVSVSHNRGCNCDITMPTLHFVLPESLSTASCDNGRRHFVLRAISHYVDNDVDIPCQQ